MKALSGRELAIVLERHGWLLLCVQGSHNVYGKPGKVRYDSPSRFTETPIRLSDLSGKEAYAAVLAALLANKRVQLEIHEQEGCKSPGWGTRLQSVYILSD